jgi:hypothetical protein
MKVPLLNLSLSEEKVVGVRLPFSPIKVPINQKHQVCSEEEATGYQYATIVLCTDDNDSPAVLEFNQNIMEMFSGYMSRHHSAANFELLLSRDQDRTIRVSLGSIEKNDNVEILESAYNHLCDSLYGKYINNLGRKVHDI